MKNLSSNGICHVLVTATFFLSHWNHRINNTGYIWNQTGCVNFCMTDICGSRKPRIGIVFHVLVLYIFNFQGAFQLYILQIRMPQVYFVWMSNKSIQISKSVLSILFLVCVHRALLVTCTFIMSHALPICCIYIIFNAKQMLQHGVFLRQPYFITKKV